MHASGATHAALCTPGKTVIMPVLAPRTRGWLLMLEACLQHDRVQSKVGVLARRKPTLLLRLSGWLLLRLAERRLLGLLFHEPPRRTREDGAVQAPGRNAKRKRSPETEDEGSSTA